MHRNRIPILTQSTTDRGHWKTKRKPRSTRMILWFLLLLLWLLCMIIPYITLWSLHSNNNNNRPSPQIHYSTQNTTLPALRAQIYQPTQQQQHPPPPPIHSQFLIFKGFMKGQGTGNFMNGLLATHLLALEFNRTVCVSPDYKDFHLAFQPRQAALKDICAPILKQYNQNIELRIMLNNFGKPPNECQLQIKLAEQPVLVVLANTYPRWPVVPDDFFFTHYEPTPQLLAMLPYRTAPRTVVHLRRPDKRGADDRKGLDLASFQQLYETLPSDTYLVTNNVAWYQHFPTWQHPSWKIVQHTATSKFWGNVPEHDESLDHSRQVLQMWADWFSILSAQHVVHTASDFSHSAVHWQNIPSQEINGILPNGKLDLVPESWIRDGETPRLVDRRIGASNNADLRRCVKEEKGKWD